MHLAHGTFHVGSHIYRYNIQKMYDECYPAATLYIKSDRDVRGIANLYPEFMESPTAEVRLLDANLVTAVS